MNETVKRIVDILFQDTVENEETRALHEELKITLADYTRLKRRVFYHQEKWSKTEKEQNPKRYR